MVQELKLSDVRPLIGNISRANFYEVRFDGLSAGLRQYLISRGVDNRFISSDSGLLSYQAELPGSSLATVESGNFHGLTQNFAHTKIYTPLQLSFYCDDSYRTLKFFEHWMEYTSNSDFDTGRSSYASPLYSARLHYPSDPATGYKANSVSITKFEQNYQRVLRYSFIGLFPKNLSSTQVRYGPNSELTRVSCSFSYDRYIAGDVSSYSFINRIGNNLSSLVNDFREPLSALSRLIN